MENLLLYYWLEQLSDAGAREFIVNTHYFSEKVERAVAQHPLASRVKLVYEPTLLGTAGTLKNLIKNGIDFRDETLILHADNYCECNWHAFFKAHRNRPSQALITMMSFETDTPQSCGILRTDGEQLMTGFFEKVKNPPGHTASAATFIFSCEAMTLFEQLNDNETDISHHLLPKLINKAFVWPLEGYLKDIGTPQAYQSVNNRLAKQDAPSVGSLAEIR